MIEEVTTNFLNNLRMELKTTTEIERIKFLNKLIDRAEKIIKEEQKCK